MTYAQQALTLVQQNHMVAESWELYADGMLDIPGDEVPVAGEVRPLEDFMTVNAYLVKEAQLAGSVPPHPRLGEALAVVARYHGEQLHEVLDLLAIKELDDVLPLSQLAEMISSRVQSSRTEYDFTGVLPAYQDATPDIGKFFVTEPGITPKSLGLDVGYKSDPNSKIGALEWNVPTEPKPKTLAILGSPSRLPHHPSTAEGRGNPVIFERMKEVVEMDRIQLVDDAARGTGTVQPGLVALARCWYEHSVGEKRGVTEGHPRLHKLLNEAVLGYKRDLLKQLEAAGFEWGYNKNTGTVILNKGKYSLSLRNGQPVVPEVK